MVEMMNRTMCAVAVAAAIVCEAVCQAPPRGRVNAELLMLMRQQRALVHRGDSVSAVLAAARRELRSGGRKDSLESCIVNLDIELFDINNQIGIIAGRLNSMELEWVVNSLDEAVAKSDTTIDSAGLNVGAETKPADMLAGREEAYGRVLDSLRVLDERSSGVPDARVGVRRTEEYGGVSYRRSRGREVLPIDVYGYSHLYAVCLGVYAEPQSEALFRRVSPVGYLVTPEGEYAYYAGEFGNEVEAFRALRKISRMGFPDAYVVMWRDGEMVFSNEK